MRRHSGKQWYYHAMILPGIVLLFIFSFIPLIGLVMAFQDYVPVKGFFKSDFVGLKNFKYLYHLPKIKQIVGNTLIVAISKRVLSVVVPVAFALLLNEIRVKFFKNAVQTISYLPHFLSWAVLATVVKFVFAYDGPVNSIFKLFGASPQIFLASNTWFRPLMVVTDIWKEFGYGAIIYLAALTGIDPGLYEAAAIDGAGRWKQLIHITLPGITGIVLVMVTMSIPGILDAGFDQIFNLYNATVYETGDVLDTYMYRVGMVSKKYSIGIAVGLVKSVIGATLVFICNKLVTTFSDRTMF